MVNLFGGIEHHKVELAVALLPAAPFLVHGNVTSEYVAVEGVKGRFMLGERCLVHHELLFGALAWGGQGRMMCQQRQEERQR